MANLDPNAAFFRERSLSNPFLDDIFSPGFTHLPGVADIHPEALSHCVKAFESLVRSKDTPGAPWGASGRTILLAAPRAGYGKSHLVGRIRGITDSLVAAITLPLDPVQPLAWETVLNSVVNQYRATPCPQNLGCTLFDETARFFQSRVLGAAIDHGNVAVGQLPESEDSIRSQFREVFDPGAANRLPVWLEKNTAEVTRGATYRMTRQWSMSSEDLAFWCRIFLDYARPKQRAFEKLDILVKAEARKRLMEFLRIASDCRPVAFIADHLDGFFGSDTAGMQIAEILTALRSQVPRSLTLLCLNEDLWNSIFEKKIPSAWVDRLTGEPAALGSITARQARELVEHRLRSAAVPAPIAERFFETFEMQYQWHAESAGESFYPREVFRMASVVWESTISRISEEAGFAATPGAGWPEMEPAAAPKPPNPFLRADGPPPLSRPAPARPPEIPFGPPLADAEAPAAAGASLDWLVPLPARGRRTAPGLPETPATPPPSHLFEKSSPFTDSDSAAKRAAGIDPTRPISEIDRLILEIRNGGRAISETPEAQRTPPASGASRFNGAGSDAPSPPPSGPASPAEARRSEAEEPNPFWAQDLEKRLQELETESLHRASSIEWHPGQIAHLVGAIGSRFPAVGQRVGEVNGAQFLHWKVRGWNVFLGFELATNLAFWGALLQRARESDSPVKVTLLSNPGTPFEPSLLPAMGIDRNAALRYLDIVELTASDMALLHAAEKFLKDPRVSGQIDAAIRIVARRLDPFWRRVSRPLIPVEPAA